MFILPTGTHGVRAEHVVFAGLGQFDEFVGRDRAVEGAADEADPAAQFRPVAPAILLAEHGEGAGGGRQIAVELHIA